MKDKERAVLDVLGPIALDDEACAMNFRGIARQTGLTFNEVRHACRSLRARGLAQFVRPMWSIDEGCPMGSGYCATLEGHHAWLDIEEAKRDGRDPTRTVTGNG